MILRVLFGVLVGYIVYKLLVDLIFPVIQTTRQVRQQFKDVHQHMQEQANRFQQQQTNEEQVNKPNKPSPKQPVGDYIEFEDVK